MDTKDLQQDAYSNDGLDSLFLSKVEDIVKDEHVINTIKRCFIEHNVTYCYFQNHKRKDLAVLLRKYKIKISISMKLWAAFSNNNDNWSAKKMCLDSPQELRKNKECIPVHSVCLEIADIHNQYDSSIELIGNQYTEQYAHFTSPTTKTKFSNNAEHKGTDFDDNTESKGTEEDPQSIKHVLYTVFGQYFHDRYDIIKVLIFYYASIDMLPLIKLSLNKINWSNMEIIKSQSTSNDSINKSVAIPQKAMNEFCFMALERLNNNYNDNLIQIDETEWVLIVHIIDDDGSCDIGVSFKYNDKSENLVVATAIYLDREEIESKHKLIGLKHNYCKNLRPFSLREIKFVNDNEIMEMKQDDDDYDDEIRSEMECQSDWESL